MADPVPQEPETAPDVVFTRVTDGAVLLSTEEEVYYGLNPVGTRVWELVEEGRSAEEICSTLQRAFDDVDAETIRRDVAEILGDLADHGLIRRS